MRRPAIVGALLLTVGAFFIFWQPFLASPGRCLFGLVGLPQSLSNCIAADTDGFLIATILSVAMIAGAAWLVVSRPR